MYKRLLSAPEHSFFLFGPRGTGKTTWLRQCLPDARWYDLLRNDLHLRLLKDPSLFRREVEATAGGWIVIDEVQKLPRLLDEVHGLIAEHGSRYRFALSGSSARKLRRMDVNLLAGRVINRTFFPLTLAELGAGPFRLDEMLATGLLPGLRSHPEYAIDVLEAYVANYLREEIQQEALVKDIDSFARFLEVAALMNGQVVNVSGIARDAGVARPTVQRYFETLVGTLVGAWLPAWKPRRKVKEVSHPKFYFFDTGVVRALLGRLREPLEGAERGHLLETLVFHELRSHVAYSGQGGELAYWSNPSRSEVDFVWTRGTSAVGIEVKASREWRREHGRVLGELLSEGIIQRAVGVYLGRETLREGALEILPIETFSRRLHDGDILPKPRSASVAASVANSRRTASRRRRGRR